MERIFNIFIKPLNLGILLILITVAITTQNFLLPRNAFNAGMNYTHYNNFIIFRQSFFHLLQNKDLYQLFPEEHYDLYKYSPTFSLLMGPFAYLPDWIGLFTWNLVNALVFLFAIWKLPLNKKSTNFFILVFVIIELITAMQNSQSNTLITGLIILAFNSLEKNNIAIASLFISLTVFIKLFGVLAFVLFLFYPEKTKSFLYTLLWFFILLFLPLLIVSWNQFSFLYKSWANLLANDHDSSYGLSVAGWLYYWFNMNISKNIIVMTGALIFLIPLIHFNHYSNFKFKILFLASILLWVVIFNHKAESPTFILAVSGVSIWYFYRSRNIIDTSLLIFTFLFTVISPTDIFPKVIRENYVQPYVLKAVPCILIWMKLSYELITFPKHHEIKSSRLA